MEKNPLGLKNIFLEIKTREIRKEGPFDEMRKMFERKSQIVKKSKGLQANKIVLSSHRNDGRLLGKRAS